MSDHIPEIVKVLLLPPASFSRPFEVYKMAIVSEQYIFYHFIISTTEV